AGERQAWLAHGNSPPAADTSWCGRYSCRHATVPHRLMRFCLFCARERDRHPDGFAPISNHAPPSCGSRTRGATAYLLILSAAPAAARRRKMLVIRCLCACRLLNDCTFLRGAGRGPPTQNACHTMFMRLPSFERLHVSFRDVAAPLSAPSWARWLLAGLRRNCSRATKISVAYA